MDDARLGLSLWAATALVNLVLASLVGVVAALWSIGDRAAGWAASRAGRLSRTCRWMAVGCAFADVLLLWVQTALISDLPLSDALTAVPDVLAHTHLGLAWAAGAAAMVVLLGVAGSALRLVSLRGLIAVSACVALFIASRSAASHAAAADRLLPVLVDGLHLLSVSLWSGSVFVAAAVVLREPRPRDLADPLDRDACGHYLGALSAVATWALAVVVVTGAYSSWRGLGGFAGGGITTTSYGVIWVVKMVLVGAAIALGAYNRFVTLPPLLVQLHSPRASFDRTLPCLLRSFTAVLRAESVVLLLVLIAAAALGTSAPVSNP